LTLPLHFFQIGEDKYGYKYSASTMKVNGSPVYQCIRSSDVNSLVRCLWLYKSSDGHWIATDAPKNSSDPVNGGIPKFRTTEPVDCIRVRQMLHWHWFKEATEQWEGALPFMTYPMPMTSPTRDLSMTSSSGNAHRLGMSGTTNTPSHVPSEPASEVQAEPHSANIPESQQHDDA
jgi:hypothetical protein